VDEGLKLSALAAEDMDILSAACVGAITSPGEMSYSSVSRQFTFTASRLMWEKQAGNSSGANRIRSGLFFGDVLSVKSMGFPQSASTTAIELLSMTTTTEEDGGANINLNFAGGVTLSLNVECVNAVLTDVGKSWHTDKLPNYEDGE